MSLNAFLKLVEIKTKIASLTPFLLGSLYSIYHYHEFSFINALLIFISLILVDMGTTAANNYQDYLKAKKKSGYNYEKHNAIVHFSIPINRVKIVIISLFMLAAFFGLLLYSQTNLVVLLIGFISFGVGILYSFGPLPISRTPFGEIFSGFFMGFLINFLSIYIHKLDLIQLIINNDILFLEFHYLEILKIFIFSLPLFLGIANIMLANNICDFDDDLKNNRFTLPIYISKAKSLKLFEGLYYISYLSILIAVLANILPLISLLTLLSIFLLKANIEIFKKKQSKEKTFVLAIKNFVILNYSIFISLVLAIIF